MEIDPELAAQMGFSSFGTASKKRKLDADEAVTDVPSNSKSATGSNSQPLGQPAAGPAAPKPTEPPCKLLFASDTSVQSTKV